MTNSNLRAVPDWEEPVTGEVVGREVVRRPTYGLQPSIARAASNYKGVSELGLEVLETFGDHRVRSGRIVAARGPELDLGDYAAELDGMIGRAGLLQVANEINRGLR